MTKTAPHIFSWLERVKIDGHLPASCFKVAYQLAQKTNGAEHEKSGALVTWQSESTIADAIQMSERTVRDMVSRLAAAGHLAIETGRGPGNSNRYTLKYRQPAAAFNDDNTGSPLPHSDENRQPAAALMRQSDVLIPAVQRMNTGSRLPPNYSISNSITSSPTTTETERGPRQRADALGPLGEKLQKRIGPAKFHDWFDRGKVEIVSQTADTIKLAASSTFFAEQIQNRFETDITACAGVVKVEVVVRPEPAP